MVHSDTPPNTPLNFSDMYFDLDQDFDIEDLEEISLDDLQQQMDEDDEDEDGDLNDSGVEESESGARKADLTFKEHKGPVFCCHLDPKDGLLAVTGGEDERMLLWNTESGEVIFEEKGFKDSIISVEFSHDGKYVAAGCMGGVIKVWRVRPSISPTNPPQEVFSENLEEVVWLKWHHKSNVLFGGVLHGEIFMWKIPHGECKAIQGPGSTCNVGQILPDGKRLVAGFKDGVIKVYDLSLCSVIYTIRNPELDCILCLTCHSDNNLVAAGTLNTKMVLFSSQTGKVLCTLTCTENVREGSDDEDDTEEEESHKGESVESIVFPNDSSLSLLAVGTISTIVIYDYSKQVVRSKCIIQEGITLLWNFMESLFFIGTQTGEVKVMEALSGNITSNSLYGHTDIVLDMCFSKNAKKLLTGSDDKTAKVFSFSY